MLFFIDVSSLLDVFRARFVFGLFKDDGQREPSGDVRADTASGRERRRPPQARGRDPQPVHSRAGVRARFEQLTLSIAWVDRLLERGFPFRRRRHQTHDSDPATMRFVVTTEDEIPATNVWHGSDSQLSRSFMALHGRVMRLISRSTPTLSSHEEASRPYVH